MELHVSTRITSATIKRTGTYSFSVFQAVLYPYRVKPFQDISWRLRYFDLHTYYFLRIPWPDFHSSLIANRMIYVQIILLHPDDRSRPMFGFMYRKQNQQQNEYFPIKIKSFPLFKFRNKVFKLFEITYFKSKPDFYRKLLISDSFAQFRIVRKFMHTCISMKPRIHYYMHTQNYTLGQTLPICNNAQTNVLHRSLFQLLYSQID